MRISDWSSDVCSSDLHTGLRPAVGLCEVAVDDKLQHKFGIEPHAREKVIETSDPFSIRQIIKHRNHFLFELVCKEYAKEFDRIGNTICRATVDVFFNQLDRAGDRKSQRLKSSH